MFATMNPITGIIAWKNPKENAIFMASWVRIFFSDIPVPTDTANASAATESARRSVVIRFIEYMNYLPRPAARPGRCLFGGEKLVAHLPNLLPAGGPNRDAFGAVGGIFVISVDSSVVFSSSRSWSGVVICDILVGYDYRKIGFFSSPYCFLRHFALATRRPPGPYLLGHCGHTLLDFLILYASSRVSSSSSARCGGRAGRWDIGGGEVTNESITNYK